MEIIQFPDVRRTALAMSKETSLALGRVVATLSLRRGGEHVSKKEVAECLLAPILATGTEAVADLVMDLMNGSTVSEPEPPDAA